MQGREAFEQLEHAEHGAREGGFVKRAAILVAVLAALLAVATLSANNATKDTILRQAQATDAYNEFEANSLKAHVNDGDAAILRAAAAQGAGAPAEAARSRADALERAVRDKYDPTKDRLLVTARDLEHDRDVSEAQHVRFALSEGAFEIGIVLVSVALVSGAVWLSFAGGGLGVAGIALLAAGYLVR